MSDERVSLILSEEPVPRFTILPKRPAARAGIAIVYSVTGTQPSAAALSRGDVGQRQGEDHVNT